VEGLLDDVFAGRGRLRPVNKLKAGTQGSVISGDRIINTEYPAYKIGIRGTNNRAIVLLPEKIEGEQVVILAALYDHEDQQKVTKAIGG
jgi:hypothetical protein